MGCTVQSMLRSGRSVRILGCEVHSRGRTPHGVRGLKSRTAFASQPHPLSHPSRGAWIEIRWTCWCATRRRRSHPSRGAWIEICRRPKASGLRPVAPLTGSHPSRGAWIEIRSPTPSTTCSPSRTPHGVRGLKSANQGKIISWLGRTPHGVRGLKCELDGVGLHAVASHPSRGAWIEIAERPCGNRLVRVAPLTGCVD